MDIETLIWRAGTNRGVSIGVTAFSGPNTFISYNNSIYTVPLIGETFVNAGPEAYTTFLGSEYSILIIGELTNIHVYEAETTIGHSVNGVNIGTSVSSIGNVGDTINSPFYNSGVSIVCFKDIVNSGCSLIGDNAFYGCSLILELTLPNSLITIEDKSFSNCLGLSFLIIPEGVINIGNNSFEDCNNLLGISLPSSLVDLGTNVFKSSGLSNIVLPNSLNIVPSGAFNSCFGLSIIDLGTCVSSIGINAFINCNLTSLTIPENVLSIGASAFKGVTGLLTVNIGSSVTSIGVDAFLNAESIDTLTWEEGTSREVTIGESSFKSPSSFLSYVNTTYNVPVEGEIFYNTNYTYTIFTGSGGVSNHLVTGALTSSIITAVKVYTTNIIHMEIGTDMTSIDANLFENDSNLLSVTTRNDADSTLTTINNNAFDTTTNLQEITLPNSVTIIGNYAIRGNTTAGNYGASIFNIPTSLTYLGQDSYRRREVEGAVVFPDSLIDTENGVFWNNNSLTSLTLGNGLDILQNNLFNLCNNLTGNLIIPDIVSKVRLQTFQNCSGYNNMGISIGTGLTICEDSSFRYCKWNQIEWMPGNARTCTFGTNCFSDNVGFGSTYNNSSYDVPIGGKIFL